jgi:hypothetical protein
MILTRDLAMSVSDLDISRSANLWLEQHGEAAVPKAREMAAALRDQGDVDGADLWLRVIVAIEDAVARSGGPES